MKSPKCPWCKAVLSHQQFRKHLWLKHSAVVTLQKSVFGPDQILAYRIDIMPQDQEGKYHPLTVEFVEVRKAPDALRDFG